MTTKKFKLSKYRKSITAVFGALVVWGTAVVFSTPTHITAAEWLTLLTAEGVALGVYVVPNE